MLMVNNSNTGIRSSELKIIHCIYDCQYIPWYITIILVNSSKAAPRILEVDKLE
jgi:hypothetical protein